MKKPRSLCTRLGAALLTVCLLLGLLPIASAASAAPRTPVAADGRILYVAPNGSDANPGSYAEPFATLEAAMNAMNPGDLLYVRGGLYRSAGTGRGISQKKGTVDKWFTVLNYPGETPVFDGEWYGDAIPMENSAPKTLSHANSLLRSSTAMQARQRALMSVHPPR